MLQTLIKVCYTRQALHARCIQSLYSCNTEEELYKDDHNDFSGIDYPPQWALEMLHQSRKNIDLQVNGSGDCMRKLCIYSC